MISIDKLEKLKEEGMQSLFPSKTKIMVGMATCGRAAGADEVWQALQEEIKKLELLY